MNATQASVMAFSTLAASVDVAAGSVETLQAANAFRVVFVSQVWSRGERSLIRSRATPSHVSAVHQQVASDEAAMSELRVHGVVHKHSIGWQETGSGRTILFIR